MDWHSPVLQLHPAQLQSGYRPDKSEIQFRISDLKNNVVLAVLLQHQLENKFSLGLSGQVLDSVE